MSLARAITGLRGLLAWACRRLAQRLQPAPPAAAGAMLDARLAEMATRVSDSLVLTDLQRRITWVNEGFVRLTGYTPAEAIGRSPAELLQFEGTDLGTTDRMRQALDAGLPVTCEVLNRSKWGQVCWLELKIQPTFDTLGHPDGFMALQIDITDRRAAEAALRAQQALLDRTGRIGGVGGWEVSLADGRMRWTDQTCRILDRALGFEPTLADCLSHCQPEGRAALLAAIEGGVDNAATWDMELPFVTAQGREIWVRVAAECEYDDGGPVRVVGALQDITQRHALKAEIRRSAELLRNAFEAVDEAFILYDPEGRFVMCNETFRRTYDLCDDVLVPGMPYEAIIRVGALRGQFAAAVGREEEWVAQRMAAHQECSSGQIQTLASGRVLRMVERRMPDGHRVGFRVDITDLVRATEAAERADRAKSEFIATISHELRTPLQAILGFSELGKHFAASHAQFEPMFQDIHAGGQRMLRLVNGLLDVSKIDGTQGSLVLKRGDIFRLVSEVARELAPLAAERQLRIALPDPLPLITADLDAFRMQQVIRNLLANALRFAPTGSAIEVTGENLGHLGVTLSVRDHGPGIPADELESVFEAFVQSSRTRTGAGGTGLGLTICRKIIGAHGGRIEALQAEGGGACLRVWLPAAAPLIVSDPTASAGTDGASLPPVTLKPATKTLRDVRNAVREREARTTA